MLAFSLLLSGLPSFTPQAPLIRARCAAPLMQQSEPPPKKKDSMLSLMGTMMIGLESAAAAAKLSTDNYINSGWQVKKRAGQLMPEIRPNAVDVQQQSERLAGGVATPAGGATSALAPTPPSAAGGALAQTDAELAQDFTVYLAEQQGAETVPGMRVSESGEITFTSREDLSALVVGFTKKKLQALAISARALARYVNDLEAELEAADEAVVEMRRAQSEGRQRQSEAEARSREIEATSAALAQKLEQAREIGGGFRWIYDLHVDIDRALIRWIHI